MPFDGAQTNEVVAVVDKMRTALKQRGWCQWKQEDADGHVCVYGALGIAVNDSPWTGNLGHGHWLTVSQAMEAEAIARGANNKSNPYPAVNYNNRMAKSVGDIMDFLDGVERRLMEGSTHAV